MLTTIEILDRLKAKLGSDYRTAKTLEIPQQRITGLRSNGGSLTDAQGLKAAQILGIKEDFVIASLVAERSKNSPAYAVLKRIANKFEPRKSAAAAFFTLTLAAPLFYQILPLA